MDENKAPKIPRKKREKKEQPMPRHWVKEEKLPQRFPVFADPALTMHRKIFCHDALGFESLVVSPATLRYELRYASWVKDKKRVAQPLDLRFWRARHSNIHPEIIREEIPLEQQEWMWGVDPLATIEARGAHPDVHELLAFGEMPKQMQFLQIVYLIEHNHIPLSAIVELFGDDAVRRFRFWLAEHLAIAVETQWVQTHYKRRDGGQHVPGPDRFNSFKILDFGLFNKDALLHAAGCALPQRVLDFCDLHTWSGKDTDLLVEIGRELIWRDAEQRARFPGDAAIPGAPTHPENPAPTDRRTFAEMLGKKDTFTGATIQRRRSSKIQYLKKEAVFEKILKAKAKREAAKQERREHFARQLGGMHNIPDFFRWRREMSAVHAKNAVRKKEGLPPLPLPPKPWEVNAPRSDLSAQMREKE